MKNIIDFKYKTYHRWLWWALPMYKLEYDQGSYIILGRTTNWFTFKKRFFGYKSVSRLYYKPVNNKTYLSFSKLVKDNEDIVFSIVANKFIKGFDDKTDVNDYCLEFSRGDMYCFNINIYAEDEPAARTIADKIVANDKQGDLVYTIRYEN